MNVTREEAAQALADIDKASDRVFKLKGYHHGAPFFIVWGFVWLIANSVSQFRPEYQRWVWPAAVGAGFVISMVIGIAQSRKSPAGTQAAALDRRVGSRIGMTSGVMMAFIATMILIAQPSSADEGNAMVSIFFPFMYMAAGIWAGWRLFAIGLVTAIAIIVGFFWMREYFDIWMGVFGGGSLIAGGIWLRTA
ncbi:MAG: hypothetical protein B7Y90_06105 [Alphaproteobacteria bacterium 32-64-14]|nr:MAG: hypothetical protein B7Y90_06105 [Alphaproteobacteria bacterium 32-64-14]